MEQNSTQSQPVTTGRTWPDLLREHPKTSFFIFFIFFAAFISIAVFTNRQIKVGPLDIGPSNDRIDNPIIKESALPVAAQKDIQAIKPKHQKQPLKKSIIVKSGDTIIKVENQSANINTGTNNGVIGNGNSVTINQFGEAQRKLNDKTKASLLSWIEKTAKENKLKPGFKIGVNFTMGNNEAVSVPIFRSVFD